MSTLQSVKVQFIPEEKRERIYAGALEVLEKTSIKRYKELQNINNVNIVVGEWSLGVHQNVKKQLHGEFITEAFYRAVGNSLLTTYETISGWFFWNYKLSEESTKKNIGWSFRDVVAKGYLPKKIKEK